MPEDYEPPVLPRNEEQNGLQLNIYVLESNLLTRNQFNEYLSTQPYFFEDSEDDRYYCNEDTNVIFAVLNISVKNGPKGYRPLDLAFFVHYGHPEYFGLEAFPVIEKLCQHFGLMLTENKGKNPQSYTAAQLHAKWLKRNDEEQMTQWYEDVSKCLGYMPREKSNQLWQYLYSSTALQTRIQRAHSKMVVGKPLCYRDETDGEVMMVTSWIDIVPLVIPPHTDYLFRVRITKKLGLVPYPKPIGYYDVHKMLKGLEDKVTKNSDGSIEIPARLVDILRTRAQERQSDLPPKHLLGEPLPSHQIVDIRS